MSHLAAIAAAVTLLLSAGFAQAQDKAKRTKAAPKVTNVIEIEETLIEGRVQKPEAFYILQRSNLNYNALEPKKSFIPKILETVKAKPF